MINSADIAAATQTDNMLINEPDYRSPPQENVKTQNEIQPKIQQNRIVSIAPTTDAFSHLSVSQRASLFFQHNDSDKLQHQKVCGKKNEESGSGRVKTRRSWLISHRERVRTQPVASEEIKQAQNILAAENICVKIRSDDVMVSETEETSISIADRARLLFAQQALNNCLNKDSCFSDSSSSIREEENIKCNVRAMVEKWRSNDLDYEKQRRVSYGDEYTSQEPQKLNISNLPYLRNKISSPLLTKRNSIIVLEGISKDSESVSDQVRQEIQEQQDCAKGDHLTSLTLAEKQKLFTTLTARNQEKRRFQKKSPAATARRNRNRTQPITRSDLSTIRSSSSPPKEHDMDVDADVTKTMNDTNMPSEAGVPLNHAADVTKFSDSVDFDVSLDSLLSDAASLSRNFNNSCEEDISWEYVLRENVFAEHLITPQIDSEDMSIFSKKEDQLVLPSRPTILDNRSRSGSSLSTSSTAVSTVEERLRRWNQRKASGTTSASPAFIEDKNGLKVRSSLRRCQTLPDYPNSSESFIDGSSSSNNNTPFQSPCKDTTITEGLVRLRRKSLVTSTADSKCSVDVQERFSRDSPLRTNSPSVRALVQNQEQKSVPTTSISENKDTRAQWTKNEAVAKRVRRLQEQAPEPDKADVAVRKRSSGRPYQARTNTQPITRDEMDANVMAYDSSLSQTSSSSTSSISQRLNQLKESGEKWRSKYGVDTVALKKTEISTPTASSTVEKELPTGGSLTKTLIELQSSRESWRTRLPSTGVNDAYVFTVDEKLRKAGVVEDVDEEVTVRQRAKSSLPSVAPPLVASSGRKGRASLTRQSARAVSFHGRLIRERDSPVASDACGDPQPHADLDKKHDSKSDTLVKARSPALRAITIDKSAALQVFETKEQLEHLEMQKMKLMTKEKDDKVPELSTTTVHVPSLMDEQDRLVFFNNPPPAALAQVPVTQDDFDEIFMSSEHVLQVKRHTAQAPRRKHTGSQNPLRALASRADVKESYVEPKNTGVVDREMRRVKRDQLALSASPAEAALRALAEKADLQAIQLRSAVDASNTSSKFLPYRPLMLLKVKGRRHVQTRLVAPILESFNSGDCFILVSPQRIYLWIGQFANVIENSKAHDVASSIVAKKDLGYKGAQPYLVIDEGKIYGESVTRFWQTLGYDYVPKIESRIDLDEDELYEQTVCATNMIYTVVDDTLMPCKEFWGRIPRKEMLTADACFLFDFGSEVYVWSGKNVSMQVKKTALILMQHLLSLGYDYSTSDANPLACHNLSGEESVCSGESRPDWIVSGKLSENTETSLFREKFFNWPDSSRLIKTRSDTVGSVCLEPGEVRLNFDSLDGNVMLNNPPVNTNLILEGASVGRGGCWSEVQDGIRRSYEVVTHSVKVWHVSEFERQQLDEESFGQFHTQNTYVVRWHYQIQQGGRIQRRQQETLTGRERFAYFFWQGRQSSVAEKGASALMTMELDEERGPQIRVPEGSEPPAFLHLFGSRMIIHLGKRAVGSSMPTRSEQACRLFLLCGLTLEEAHLLEVKAASASLRSRGVFVLFDEADGVIYLWCGGSCPSMRLEIAKHVVAALRRSPPKELFFSPPQQDKDLVVLHEGRESRKFWNKLNGARRIVLTKDVTPFNANWKRLRAFKFSSVSGQFRYAEISNVQLLTSNIGATSELADAASFQQLWLHQDGLYGIPRQPAFCLIDTGDGHLYLWQGWWQAHPSSVELTNEMDNVGEEDVAGVNGSARARYHAERIAALKTILSYYEAKKRCDSTVKCSEPQVVYAGLEPNEFIEYFPVWNHNAAARQSNLKEGRVVDQKDSVDQLLERLEKLCFSLEQLQQAPLPEGVDPNRIEYYLSGEEFLDVFKMHRDEFQKLPFWKQCDMKKAVGLF